MDGDFYPMQGIVAVTEKQGAKTYPGEVRAVGLDGARGGGMSERQGLSYRITVIEATLDKVHGVVDDYITGSEAICDTIRTFSCGFNFTTALLAAMYRGHRTSGLGAQGSVETMRYQPRGGQIVEPGQIGPIRTSNQSYC
jgi:5-aminolevulinate synthase